MTLFLQQENILAAQLVRKVSMKTQNTSRLELHLMKRLHISQELQLHLPHAFSELKTTARVLENFFGDAQVGSFIFPPLMIAGHCVHCAIW
jgi:hypothetical protein